MYGKNKSFCIAVFRRLHFLALVSNFRIVEYILHSLLKHLFSLLKMARRAAEDLEAEADDARLCADASITVADMEVALQAYFDAVGYRNLEEIMEAIVEAKTTWRSAPKAGALDLVQCP